MGGQEDYLVLLSKLTSIEPSRNMPRELVRLAKKPLRENDLD
jgi:hypothetical protein